MRAEPYDREARTRFVDDMVRVYTREALARARTGVLGLRATGVCGRHGAFRYLTRGTDHRFASGCEGSRGAELLAYVVRKHESAIRQGLLAEPLRKELAREYLRVLGGHSQDALRVVNKQPLNSDYLGLIHSVFPNARVIYLRRDPIDTCLSCYFQQFTPVMNFTMDLSDLAHYYREHQRLVAHWRDVLPPETLLVVPYEELIADQERWTRRILDFLELPWDERCLDFHKTVRPVLDRAATGTCGRRSTRALSRAGATTRNSSARCSASETRLDSRSAARRLNAAPPEAHALS